MYSAPSKRPPHRREKDAVELAVNGFDYDADEIADLSADEVAA